MGAPVSDFVRRIVVSFTCAMLMVSVADSVVEADEPSSLAQPSLAQPSLAKAEQRPNVLFIAMDDLNDWIGCLKGHPQTITPNLDRLASKGVLFTNAHCPAPACNPCRSAIFTGRSPHRTGMYDNRQQMREVMPDEDIIPQYFRNNGYYSAGSGKLLHYFIDGRSWDQYFPKAASENPLPKTFYPSQRPVNLTRGGPWQYVETDWASLDVTDAEYGGDWSVSKWIGEQLSEKHSKPFFLGCGIYRPHEPWFVPKKYFEPFPLEQIQLPPGYLANDLDDVPEVGQRRARNRYFKHIQEQDQWKKGVQGYLASIHFADAMLGRVLDALEAGPNANNTIVVLWSDHGWQLGEKEHWQKYTPWRAVTRIPLMINVPEAISAALPAGTKAGSVCKLPVNLLSLYPTLLDLCGLPKKDNNDGPSLLPLLKDAASSEWNHQSVTFLSTPESYAVSGRTHRYIHYEDGSEELYDIEADPYEWNNLAAGNSAAGSKSESLLAKFRATAPKDFAKRIEPSVESLVKLNWHPATADPIPPSKPEGGLFPVYFTNKQRGAVELFWVGPKGQFKSYGLIASGDRMTQKTRPGAVWLVQDPKTSQPLGYFVVGDRTAEALIPAGKPNVVVIQASDLGWADLGCQAVVSDIKTPNIDALAARGVRCVAGYATSAEGCSSRTGLMTGRYQQRLGINSVSDLPMAASAVTIAEHLQPLGYRTGFVGKWHLQPNDLCVNWLRDELPEMVEQSRDQLQIPFEKVQPFSPEAQGFHEYFWGQQDDYRINFELGQKVLLNQMKVVQNSDFRIDVQTQAATTFIDRNHEEPFYLQLNYSGPHTPLEAPAEYLERFSGEMPERRRYALAMISAIDDGVGRIVDRLKECGQLDNTLIVFTSDNGAPLNMTKSDQPVGQKIGGWNGSLNDPWVGEKAMLTEGGIRVPLIWSMPSQLPMDATYDYPVSTLDVAPTIVQLAGGTQPTGAAAFDGINVFPRFNSIQIPSTRTLYFRFGAQAAIRRGKWKYISVATGQKFLFDLEGDQHETANLVEQHGVLARSLHDDLMSWTQDLLPAGLPAGDGGREQDWYDFYFDGRGIK